MQRLANNTNHVVGVTQDIASISKEIRDDLSRLNESFGRYDEQLHSEWCSDIATARLSGRGGMPGCRPRVV